MWLHPTCSSFSPAVTLPKRFPCWEGLFLPAVRLQRRQHVCECERGSLQWTPETSLWAIEGLCRLQLFFYSILYLFLLSSSAPTCSFAPQQRRPAAGHCSCMKDEEGLYFPQRLALLITRIMSWASWVTGYKHCHSSYGWLILPQLLWISCPAAHMLAFVLWITSLRVWSRHENIYVCLCCCCFFFHHEWMQAAQHFE